MADDMTLEELLRRLTPLVQSIVTTSVQEAIGQTVGIRLVPGLVTQLEGTTAFVRMDDGGLSNAPTPGIVPVTRLGDGVVVGERVLVAFFPTAGTAVAWSVDGT